MRRIQNTLVLAAWLALVLQVGAAHAQEASTEEPAAPEVALSADAQQLLAEFEGDLPARLGAAEQDVLLAQQALDDALLEGTATDEEIAALEAKLLESETALGAVEAELQLLRDLVAQLSEEQAAALIRSLNNALASGLLLTLDTALLQQIVDGGYDKHDIQALTQALEQEARFMAKADRFEARDADSGGDAAAAGADPSLDESSSQMERMMGKASSEKEKFLSKIEDEPAPEPGVEEAVDEVADAAVDEAIDDAVMEVAKATASGAAKQAAKREARLLAKATAKDTFKESGKSATSNGKGHTK